MIDLDRGACRSVDPAVFYQDGALAEALAKRICAGCEVRLDCLVFALSTGNLDGVWGGLTAREREPHNALNPPPDAPMS
jgi:WhiB family redox-sensing transcriptional regulator